MNRRTFIAGLGSAVTWPIGVQAQRPDAVRRIGVVKGRSIVDLPVDNEAAPSLTRQLGLFLEKAEELLGPHDKSFTLLGTEFHDGPNRVIYPNANHDQIVIQLSKEARGNHDQALFQLAHETVHVLAPVDGVHPLFLKKDWQPTSV
jgi:hypothetical protein